MAVASQAEPLPSLARTSRLSASWGEGSSGKVQTHKPQGPYIMKRPAHVVSPASPFSSPLILG